MICGAANSLWMAGCLPELARFRRAMTRVGEEQEALLRRLLRANAQTEFGREHGFSDIRTVREYQRRVPLRTHEEYQSWIDRVAAGAPNVLTRDRVRLFEPTSGSAGATKLIPFTNALQQEFQRGIRPWVADLFLRYQQLVSGQAYWSVTPAAGPRCRTSGGIPIGFEDDSFYVGGWQRRFVQAVMVVPTGARHAPDAEAVRYLTLLALIRSSNLRLISVWNPTFLSLLVDRLPAWGEALAHDLHPDARRADVLRAALRASTPEERHAVLWPHLHTISCWTDANAAAPSVHVARLFPQARIQGKGLIATEGFISLPLVGHEGAALAVRSHFLEFAPLDSRGETSDSSPRLADELERGHRYVVVLSTGGGLYRYRLNDVVEVIGHLRQCPLIRFVGRQSYISDWFGEKLNEAYVASVLSRSFEQFGISPSFAMLACDATLRSPAYVLYIETSEPDGLLDRLAGGIDAELRRSFHYDCARLLGQLAPLRVFRAEGAGEAHLTTAVRAGQRAGDVKPLALDRRGGWSHIFRGRFVSEVTSANAT